MCHIKMHDNLPSPFSTPMDATLDSPTTVYRAPWLRRCLFLAVLGVAIAIAGFIYGIVMVGAAYQDPTPAMAKSQVLHLSISGWGVIIGAFLLLVALTASVIVVIFRSISRIGD